MRREGLVHTGVELQSGRERHRIAFDELTGKTIVVYGQTEVVKDLIEARLESGRPLLFEVERRLAPRPRRRAPARSATARGRGAGARVRRHSGVRRLPRRLAGRASRRACCASSTREYPYGWLGILAEVAPSNDELVYAHNERGFALLSMRSPELSRLYLQCAPDEELAGLARRADLGGAPGAARAWRAGRSAKGRSSKRASHRCGASSSSRCSGVGSSSPGDAAHIVPPTGAKGLNLAVRDVQVLAEALAAWYRRRRRRAARRATRRRACDASGAPSTSPGG